MKKLGRLARGLPLGALFMLAAWAPSAHGAEFGIVPGSVAVRTIDAGGDPDLRAGAHPDRLQADFGLEVEGTGTSAREWSFEFSPGLTADPSASPNCPRSEFETEACDADTEIGSLTMRSPGDAEITAPIFQLEPEPDQLIALGAGSPWGTQLELSLRPGDYGLTLSTGELPPVPVEEGTVELRGEGADGPFLTTPTRCGPIGVTFRTRSLAAGAPSLSESANSASLGGCEALPFAPQFGFEASVPVADSPTGASIEVSVPEYQDLGEPVGSQIENMTFELPAGFVISPAGLDGSKFCSVAQFGQGTSAPVTCDPLSRVGSAQLSGSSFEGTLTGSLYLGAGLGSERFRLFIAAAGGGARVKLIGSLRADPETGRLTIALASLPQLPWTDISLEFDGGPDALLGTPIACGTPTAAAKFDPYAEVPAVESTVTAPIAPLSGSQCSGGLQFAPEMVTNVTDRRAGRITAFSTNLSRRDGEQLPQRFSVTLPKGLSAAPGIGTVCPEIGTATGFCPPDSKMGSVLARFGSGPKPASLTGDTYLTGPYRRAPFGLALTFRAAVGPLDLGRVSLRAAVRIDRRTGQVTIESDPLPALIEGIPIRFKTFKIDLDREGFIRNATSCKPKTIVSTVRSSEGASLLSTSGYEASGCKNLKFRPSFSLGLSGASQLRRDGHPGLRIAAKVPRQNANLSAFDLWLPKSVRLDSTGVGEICTRVDATDGLCPKAAKVGTSTARTSLLDEPLKGPIFVVQPKGNGFPDLWASLEGSGVEVDLGGRSVIRDGRFATRFVDLPDMPLSSLTMRLRGGEDGVLALRSDPCRGGGEHLPTSRVKAVSQNGARRRMRMSVELSPPCRAKERDEGSR